MTIRWSPEARADVERLVDFIEGYDPGLAKEIELELIEAPKRLREFPRRGAPLHEFGPREVREYRVAHYLLRYELTAVDTIVLRIFHAREDRS